MVIQQYGKVIRLHLQLRPIPFSTEDIIVNVRTVEPVTDPATGGVDYVTVTTAVTIPAGDTSADFTVTTI